MAADRVHASHTVWTQFEAWLAMRKASRQGLGNAKAHEARWSIAMLYGCPEAQRNSLMQEWLKCSHVEAKEKLSKPDVEVTNQQDKDVHLPKLADIDRAAQRMMKEPRRLTTSESIQGSMRSLHGSLTRPARRSIMPGDAPAPRHVAWGP